MPTVHLPNSRPNPYRSLLAQSFRSPTASPETAANESRPRPQDRRSPKPLRYRFATPLPLLGKVPVHHAKTRIVSTPPCAYHAFSPREPSPASCKSTPTTRPAKNIFCMTNVSYRNVLQSRTQVLVLFGPFSGVDFSRSRDLTSVKRSTYVA